MDEKGVIKFDCYHELSELDKSVELIKLIKYRNISFEKGYIGVYSNGIGFGNISYRLGNDFLVSGSATGMIKEAGDSHFSLVTKWEAENNQLWCKGPVKASSESLTHAVIYDALPQVNAILHIHSEKLWNKYYHQLSSTTANIDYGTPEMADAVVQLINAEKFTNSGIFLMQGHQDGIVALAKSFKKVFELVDEL